MNQPPNPYSDPESQDRVFQGQIPQGRQFQGQYPQGQQPQGPPRKNSTVFIILAVCLAGMVPMMCICAGLLLPAVQAAREASRRMSCSNNMKQIALAFHNYHSTHKQLPPAYTVDANGTPLHSWRTALLPFYGDPELKSIFKQIDFDKPWDDPANIALSEKAVPVYACPSSKFGSPNLTTYVAIVDPVTLMTGPQPVRFRDAIDGLSTTIMIVEADAESAVPWMMPQDITADEFLNPAPRRMGGHPGGRHVAMGDGAIKFITDDIDPDLCKALITKAGKEMIGPDL